MYHSLFIHSPTEGHLSCCQVWAILNKAVINICVCMDRPFQFIWVKTKEQDRWIIRKVYKKLPN